MYIVVSYDMEDDKRRGRVHRILKNFGQWVQYSVFECDLTRAQYLLLRDRLDDTIKKAEGDSVRFYFLCEDCQKKVERIGGEVPHQGGDDHCVKFFLVPREHRSYHAGTGRRSQMRST